VKAGVFKELFEAIVWKPEHVEEVASKLAEVTKKAVTDPLAPDSKLAKGIRAVVEFEEHLTAGTLLSADTLSKAHVGDLKIPVAPTIGGYGIPLGGRTGFGAGLALRGGDFVIGMPHIHNHPPNVVPPAPPIPLPSFGPVLVVPFISGASTVLINNKPAARCTDMGLAYWCGGFFPLFTIWTGSSNVWIQEERAARTMIDIVFMCQLKESKIKLPGMDKPLPLPPPLGTTIAGSPNVIIGGFPTPSLTDVIMGAALRGLMRSAKLIRRALKKRKVRKEMEAMWKAKEAEEKTLKEAAAKEMEEKAAREATKEAEEKAARRAKAKSKEAKKKAALEAKEEREYG
jgi:hypothetical protein